MTVPCFCRVPGRLGLFLALLALALSSGRARAQTCPSVSLTITRTTAAGDPTGPNQDAQLTGSPEVVFSQQGTVDGTIWLSQYLLNIYAPDGVLVWQTVGTTGTLVSGESYFDWLTSGMRRPYDPANPPLRRASAGDRHFPGRGRAAAQAEEQPERALDLFLLLPAGQPHPHRQQPGHRGGRAR